MTLQDAPETTTETYAVIYDSWSDEEMAWEDDSYEPFASEKEAEEAFVRAFGDEPQMVQNPRIVKVVRKIPGNWGDSAGQR